jgi:uncharacterized membrane protein
MALPPKWFFYLMSGLYAIPSCCCLAAIFTEIMLPTFAPTVAIACLLTTFAAYLFDLMFAVFKGWASWYYVKAERVIRHHGTFTVVFIGPLACMIFESENFWALSGVVHCMRINMISCTIPCINEGLMILQNLAPDPDAPILWCVRKCLAFGVMLQSVIVGCACIGYFFIRAKWEVLAEGYVESLPVILFQCGLCVQVIGHLVVQLPDILKLRRQIPEYIREAFP